MSNLSTKISIKKGHIDKSFTQKFAILSKCMSPSWVVKLSTVHTRNEILTIVLFVRGPINLELNYETELLRYKMQFYENKNFTVHPAQSFKVWPYLLESVLRRRRRRIWQSVLPLPRQIQVPRRIPVGYDLRPSWHAGWYCNWPLAYLWCWCWRWVPLWDGGKENESVKPWLWHKCECFIQQEGGGG